MSDLGFWSAVIGVILVSWFLAVCAALGVNILAEHIAVLVEPYV